MDPSGRSGIAEDVLTLANEMLKIGQLLYSPNEMSDKNRKLLRSFQDFVSSSAQVATKGPNAGEAIPSDCHFDVFKTSSNGSTQKIENTESQDAVATSESEISEVEFQNVSKPAQHGTHHGRRKLGGLLAHSYRLVPCLHCGQRFRGKLLAPHIRSAHHGAGLDFRCAACKRPLPTSMSVNKHLGQMRACRQWYKAMQRHGVTPPKACKKLRTSILSSDVKTVDDVKKSVQRGTPCPQNSAPMADYRRRVAPCPHCGRRLMAQDLTLHIRAVHGNVGVKYQCAACKTRCLTALGVAHHLKRTQTCRLWYDARSRSGMAPKAHKKSAASNFSSDRNGTENVKNGAQGGSKGRGRTYAQWARGYRVVPCPHCSKRLMTANNLTMHMRLAHGGAGLKFHCAACNMRFLTSCNVQGHVQRTQACRLWYGARKLNPQVAPESPEMAASDVEEDVTVACSKADPEDAQRAASGQQESTQPAVRGSGRVPCPHCGLRLTTSANLLRHVRVRHGDALLKFHCAACNLRFLTAQNIKYHLQRMLPCRRFYHARNRSAQAAPQQSTETSATSSFPSDVKDIGGVTSKLKSNKPTERSELINRKFHCHLCSVQFSSMAKLYSHRKKFHPMIAL